MEGYVKKVYETYRNHYIHYISLLTFYGLFQLLLSIMITVYFEFLLLWRLVSTNRKRVYFRNTKSARIFSN